jgi:hypothetical protein
MLNKKTSLIAEPNSIPTYMQGSAGQKEQRAPRCASMFELTGDHAQCLLPAGHAGAHSFEVPPLPRT